MDDDGSFGQGSSPRMRGAPRLLQGHLPPGGIIPAYAGSTRFEMQTTLDERDHPRVCGEHGMDKSMIKIAQGSSPRMRGAR